MTKPYCNHGLHIVLTVLTGGLWLFVYVPVLMKHGNEMKAYNARNGRR